MKFFDKELPTELLQVLGWVQYEFPRAVLAGGAVRDTLFGGPVKDIDIFIPWSDDEQEHRDALRSFLESMRYRRSLYVSGASGYASGMRGEVSLVEEFRRDGELPIQLIFLNLNPFTPLAVLKRMDFGACQVGTDGQKPFATTAALHDFLGRRFTLLRCEDYTQAVRSLKRADRFRERYPDATFDLCALGRHLNVADIAALREAA